MSEDLARALIDRLAAEGYEPYDYSGRAMYGERCVAVDLDSSAGLFKMGMDLMRSADGADLVYSDEDRLTQLYTDSMGLGIVAYWRYVAWPAGYVPPITQERLMELVDEDYGQEGLDAMRLVCIGDEDLQQGRDHCVQKIMGALEEEMTHAAP